jgi:CHRD domain-containing protein
MLINIVSKVQTIAIVAAFSASIMAISLVILPVNLAAYTLNQGTFTFGAKLGGKSEVPPVATQAVGGVGFNLSSDGNKMDYMIIAMTRSNGTFNVTSADVHQGKAGNNGPIIAKLGMGFCPGVECETPAYIGNGILDSSSLQGPLNGKPLSDMVSLIKNGEAYVNVHTKQHPEGEIRGQISR